MNIILTGGKNSLSDVWTGSVIQEQMSEFFKTKNNLALSIFQMVCYYLNPIKQAFGQYCYKCLTFPPQFDSKLKILLCMECGMG